MRLAIIFNPTANAGQSKRRWESAAARLTERKADYEFFRTEEPGHATRLARRLATEFDAVVAGGGDGTVQEVAAGLLASERSVPLGILPLGTGNDLVKPLGIPLRPYDAVDVLLESEPAAIDYGSYDCRMQDGHRVEGIFVNALGVGFDAQVAAATADRVMAARKASAIKTSARKTLAPKTSANAASDRGTSSHSRLPGFLAYLSSALRALRTWQSPSVTISADPGGLRGREDRRETQLETLFEGQIFLALAAIGTCQGGGFYLTPGASIRDGLLDIRIIERLSLLRIAKLVPAILQGREMDDKRVRASQTNALHLASSVPVPVHADGEVIGRTAREVTAQVVAGGLQVLAPPS